MELFYGCQFMLVAHSPIYLANTPVDMRKSIDTLCLFVVDKFDQMPSDGSYYIFCNKAKDKMKVLYWDKDGFALWYKRLEKTKFKLDFGSEETLHISADEFNWLLSGLDYRKQLIRPPQKYDILY